MKSAIIIDGCDNITILNNTIIGAENAIIATSSRNLNIADNKILGKNEIIQITECLKKISSSGLSNNDKDKIYKTVEIVINGNLRKSNAAKSELAKIINSFYMIAPSLSTLAKILGIS